LIPLKDENPTQTTPIVTSLLIAVNTLVFLYQIFLGSLDRAFVFRFGAIPAELLHLVRHPQGSGLPPQITVLTSMFLHGGFFHLAGNMLYLWIFGNNIEDVMGHVRFILFYLICGIIAVYTYAFINSDSTVPMIGASGAISGVLGAYLLLFPHARVLTLLMLGFFIQFVDLPAVVVLGFWIVIQLLYGIFSLAGPMGAVAWFAHIGGVLAGMALVWPFKKRRPRPFSDAS
jgi:rhomboid family protein